MSRYLIGQALGYVADVARERWREVTGIADRERAHTQAMVDLATVCDDARRYLRERDAARAEVERLTQAIGDALATEDRIMDGIDAIALRGEWAEHVANEAMCEGLAAVDAASHLAAEFLATIRRQRAALDAFDRLAKAARACGGEETLYAFSHPRSQLRDALRALDESETGR